MTRRVFLLNPVPLMRPEALNANFDALLSTLQANLPDGESVNEYEWAIRPHPLKPMGHYIALATKRGEE